MTVTGENRLGIPLGPASFRYGWKIPIQNQPDEYPPTREHHPTPEETLFIESNQSAWFGHMYQPIRILRFEGEEEIYNNSLEHMSFPVHGDFNNTVDGINMRIFEECYRPLIDSDILASPFVGMDVYASISDWIKGKRPEFWPKLQKIMAEKPGFAGTPTQVILPLVSKELAKIIVGIGIKAYEEDYGKKPLGFWPPELAVNQETIDLLAEKGARFLVLGRNQIEAKDEAPIYALNTSSGDVMYIFPYNHTMSQQIGFSDYLFADSFADDIRYNLRSNGISAFGANDVETIGHHKGKDSLAFAKYFFKKELPKRVKTGQLNWQRRTDMIIPARLRGGITSWSCEHNGGRWNGLHNCDCDGTDGFVRGKKQELYGGLILNLDSTLERLNTTFGSCWEGKFEDFYLDQRVNLASGTSVSLEGVDPELRYDFKRLIVEIMGLQSCAFFFYGNFGRGMAMNCLNYLSSQQKQE